MAEREITWKKTKAKDAYGEWRIDRCKTCGKVIAKQSPGNGAGYRWAKHLADAAWAQHVREEHSDDDTHS